jgi:hypothetical protein
LVSWKSKKQLVIARFSAEVEYYVMTLTVSELIWLETLLEDLCFSHLQPMFFYYDNQVVMHIREQVQYLIIETHNTRSQD